MTREEGLILARSNLAPAGWESVRPPEWGHVFVIGLVLWVLSVQVTGLTGNLNTIPTE